VVGRVYAERARSVPSSAHAGPDSEVDAAWFVRGFTILRPVLRASLGPVRGWMRLPVCVCVLCVCVCVHDDVII
jgi:hypothetical protein